VAEEEVGGAYSVESRAKMEEQSEQDHRLRLEEGSTSEPHTLESTPSEPLTSGAV